MSMEEETARQAKSGEGASVQTQLAQPSAEDEELAAALALSMGVQDGGDVEMSTDEEMARALEMSLQKPSDASGQEVVLFINCLDGSCLSFKCYWKLARS